MPQVEDAQDVGRYADARKAVLSVCSAVRQAMPSIPESVRVDRASISEVKEGFLDGEAIRRVIVILRGSGCAWALKEEGGCTMCGHLCGTLRGKSIPTAEFIKQFDAELAKYDFSKHPMLCVYNSGSFLNDSEIPRDARFSIYERIQRTTGIRRLIIESRPEFITEPILQELDEALPDSITTEIGVGLETSNEDINRLCVNKGFGPADFAQLAARMREHKSKLLAYVLLKPPFMTEREGIDDSCATIEFAFRVGADIVSLEPVSVQDFTLTGFLDEAGYFRPPWIWSVVEVIRRTHRLGFVRLGGFEFFPVPKTFTHNCTSCNERMIRSIQQFNRTYDIAAFDGLDCDCRRDWEFDLTVREEAMPERIMRVLGSINTPEVLSKMRMNYEVRGPESSDMHRLVFRSCSTQYA